MIITKQHDTSAILNEISEHVQRALRQMEDSLWSGSDLSAIEKIAESLCRDITALLLAFVLQRYLSDPAILNAMKAYGGSRALRFKEMRLLTLSLGCGACIKLMSPYFISRRKRRGRKKRGPNGTGYHLGLERLGCIGKQSPVLTSRIAQAALLAPSFDVASHLLREWGVHTSPNTMRKTCRSLAHQGMLERGAISLNYKEKIEGHSLVIGIDGGRLRERKPKRGRRPKHLKRQGFHTEWKEPKLFTIYMTDREGKVIRDFKPIHDATMENNEGMFQLLTRYLEAMDISKVERIIFTADGASWIWQGIEKRLDAWFVQRGFPADKIYQVLDYTHAKQHLNTLLDLLPKRQRPLAEGPWMTWLWEGKLDCLKRDIKSRIISRKNRKSAMNKWKSYFETNAERMCYSTFKQEGIVCGSGCVESAIRRVINLRLKAPGTFWLKEMAEAFLFLRSQLISGRWNVFMRNVIDGKTTIFSTLETRA